MLKHITHCGIAISLVVFAASVIEPRSELRR